MLFVLFCFAKKGQTKGDPKRYTSRFQEGTLIKL